MQKPVAEFDTYDDFINFVEVGDKLRFYYNDGNSNNRLYHVRGLVDENVIVRTWSVARGWSYKCFDQSWIVASSEHITLERQISKPNTNEHS